MHILQHAKCGQQHRVFLTRVRRRPRTKPPPVGGRPSDRTTQPPRSRDDEGKSAPLPQLLSPKRGRFPLTIDSKSEAHEGARTTAPVTTIAFRTRRAFSQLNRTNRLRSVAQREKAKKSTSRPAARGDHSRSHRRPPFLFFRESSRSLSHARVLAPAAPVALCKLHHARRRVTPSRPRNARWTRRAETSPNVVASHAICHSATSRHLRRSRDGFIKRHGCAIRRFSRIPPNYADGKTAERLFSGAQHF